MVDSLVATAASALVPVLGALVTGLVSVGVARFNRYIKARTENETVRWALERISRTARTVVAELSQTMVREMREAAEDGHLSKDEKKFLKEVAVKRVRERIPVRAAVAARSEAGGSCLEAFIRSKIEQAVLDGKG